ncbi:hypothetical protein PPL_08710 [Heterostelium album PN500]|uniref:Uncharacterized protein n=1 Tax=Heterostelium pallidum (strain ATCC 26659 / Pp 5 / PN500) TaxID=670386 RepID=D3BJI4_HETP5|nr:hypothetical protein PPL_08710 [Heterostelium album PN500]EFA78064.1 hypothetical protein PPL_08710 [Heterostelium album PN500]|eukprot:XP_020430191.1 hypothetical protein PPL_08710 [Heterostelium album PN500]
MKIQFKLTQIALFALSLYLFIAFLEGAKLWLPENVYTLASTYMDAVNIDIVLWLLSLLVFVCAWNICGVSKTFSRILLVVLLARVTLSLVSILPDYLYRNVVQLNPAYFNVYAPHYERFNTTPQILAIQAAFGLFFITLSINSKLADRFWMTKTIIIDWVLVIVALVVTSIMDLVGKSNYFFVVLAYTLGANVFGYAIMKFIEMQWAINNQYLNISNNVVFDTDATVVVNKDHLSSEATETSPSPFVDDTDYSKLSEDQLNEILSAPSPDHMEEPEDPSKVFINNLVAPVFVRSQIRSKEIVCATLLFIFVLSNRLMEHPSSINAWKLASLFGFTSTILAYFSSISTKRPTSTTKSNNTTITTSPLPREC